MRLWQLMTLTLALMASVPYAFHAIQTMGSSSRAKEQCRTSKDKIDRAFCQNAGL